MVGEKLGLELGIEVGFSDGLSDGLGNWHGITTSPSFSDARITLANTSLLTLALETRGTKQTGRKQTQFIIHTSWDNGYVGIRLGQQLGDAAGVNSGKTYRTVL